MAVLVIEITGTMQQLPPNLNHNMYASQVTSTSAFTEQRVKTTVTIAGHHSMQIKNTCTVLVEPSVTDT